MSGAIQFALLVTGVIPIEDQEKARQRIIAAVENALLTPGMEQEGIYLNACAFKTGEPKKGEVHGTPAQG